MAIILNLETATTNCSVSVSKEDKVIALKEINDKGYTHAENLHVFIKEALDSASLSFLDIDAIAVSEGPGSYTGLRIGVSAAKGLCYSLGKPLIALPTLSVLEMQSPEEDNIAVVPLLDARRMEVYAAVYKNHAQIRETKPEIITSESFLSYLNEGKVYFLGDGAEKCKGVITHENAVFQEEVCFPSAREMAVLSNEKYKIGDFVDVAYFEPYYLKDFVTTKPK
ncbi:tRNA (adenosine(37)-N6)-threonylcarbamoyltransferase complex dimerization subunit type 1 TsaB [Galbibacter pacificus]|uniref:tRNA (Adenosine(37)-N6)-threonylcarbamoyltransferase complex dimerization subunit type 1 TsaB n=1 Tax=Galbibacter pacificus TaxID=2996052 RepID=A0ABT6FSR6_9FLAO|nr:tRNA (adenosine(37)-N6)-threonylcarbamoyltransferase complex dimerization subunit type 1 TsaB [Galbibacter pacificus]MDG3582563.1 tRNA (adenosine(37)-N6)-threonylcarbamoyltransferase complex dimerization subunit type 1 TsaB [Galbibacter pacificus]MDG3586318.1 tRNA (adenosine(37)-N6)-threonylcarbamoyltransferase complex dimerization subunit type 1 TsaB [Galbibacter pacificus]